MQTKFFVALMCANIALCIPLEVTYLFWRIVSDIRFEKRNVEGTITRCVVPICRPNEACLEYMCIDPEPLIPPIKKIKPDGSKKSA
jgi:hypothetical protein